jgi:hypothetical protein
MGQELGSSAHLMHLFLILKKRFFYEKNQEKSTYGVRKLIFTGYMQWIEGYLMVSSDSF